MDLSSKGNISISLLKYLTDFCYIIHPSIHPSIKDYLMINILLKSVLKPLNYIVIDQSRSTNISTVLADNCIHVYVVISIPNKVLFRYYFNNLINKIVYHHYSSNI